MPNREAILCAHISIYEFSLCLNFGVKIDTRFRRCACLLWLSAQSTSHSFRFSYVLHVKADLPFALEKLTLSHRAMFSGHFCGLYLNCNDVDCTHGMTSHLIVNFFSRVDSRIVFVLSRVEISCWLCLRDFCVGIQILFRVLLRALTCVLDLCRLVRSSCCFCCASDDFVEPCMPSSRSACASS